MKPEVKLLNSSELKERYRNIPKGRRITVGRETQRVGWETVEAPEGEVTFKAPPRPKIEGRELVERVADRMVTWAEEAEDPEVFQFRVNYIKATLLRNLDEKDEVERLKALSTIDQLRHLARLKAERASERAIHDPPYDLTVHKED